MSSLSTSKRFTERRKSYAKFRPSYPVEALDFIIEKADLSKGGVVADIGSGTGKFSRLLLQKGFTVYGVEPNPEMRQAASPLLHFPRFHSVSGSAEATELMSNSMDLVTVAQAFDWFNPMACKEEFKRILKPGSPCVLIWNRRLTEESPFMQAYEQLMIDFVPRYKQLNATGIRASDSEIHEFYFPFGYDYTTLSNVEQLDWETLKGRLHSTAFTPDSGHPNYVPMMNRLEKFFKRMESGGVVSLEYETQIYFGCLG